MYFTSLTPPRRDVDKPDKPHTSRNWSILANVLAVRWLAENNASAFHVSTTSESKRFLPVLNWNIKTITTGISRFGIFQMVGIRIIGVPIRNTPTHIPPCLRYRIQSKLRKDAPLQEKCDSKTVTLVRQQNKELQRNRRFSSCGIINRPRNRVAMTM